MLKYNKESNTLVIKTMDDMDLKLDLLHNQKQSYQDYITKTIYEDAKYLEKSINKLYSKAAGEITTTLKVKDLVTNNYSGTYKMGDMYYPVDLTISYLGADYKYEFMRIPYMDGYTVLNVGGRRNMLLNELINLECISWDNKHQQLIVTGKDKSFNLEYTRSAQDETISIPMGGNKASDKVSYVTFLPEFLKRDREDADKCLGLFSNPLTSMGLKKLDSLLPEYRDTCIKHTNIMDRLSYERFHLGRLRQDLNYRLGIDSCLGKELSRDIILRNKTMIMEGTYVSEEILATLKRNLINEVYIKKIPNVVGQALGQPIVITSLKKGMKVNDYISEALGGIEEMYLTHSYENVDLVFPLSMKVTMELLETLYASGITEVVCQRQGYMVTYKFEQDIIGNYTAKISDFMTSVPQGYKASDYIYYRNCVDPYNSTEWETPKDYLTCWDMMSLTSLISRVIYMPELNETYDRDLDFLKRVGMSNETFSYAFKKACDSHLMKYKQDIIKCIQNGKTNDNLFLDFTKSWLKVMREEKKLLTQAEDINPIALLKQANTVSTWVKSSDSVTEEQRGLALGFYGRLCPYDIPAGKKIGLVNTLAVGCAIQDGLLKTPYREIIKDSRGSRLSNKIKYLSVLEEQKVKIGDALSLEFDEQGYIKTTDVMSRIPVPNERFEKVDIVTTKSTELQFVDACSEQFLSPTALLMPFAAGDDSARITFGINLLTQSIYLQQGEVPLVSTKMYKQIYDYSNDFTVKAEDDGTVICISENELTLQYDHSDPYLGATVLTIEETRFLNYATLTMHYKVAPGERFKKGDILVDTPVSREGYFSPGINVFAAYMSWKGYNYEDAVVISENIADKCVSIHPNECEKTKHKEKYSYFISEDNCGQYISEGMTIAKIKSTDINNENRSTEEEWKSDTKGLLYDIDVTQIDNEKVFSAKLLSFDKIQEGDKVSGRHGNKGTIALVEETANMPVFPNGKIVDFILNPTGVPSRMNLGQLLESTTGFIAYLLKIRIESEAFNGASKKDLAMLMAYVYDLANKPNAHDVVASYPQIPEELHEHALSVITRIRKWKGCFTKDCKARLYNPITGKYFYNPIGFGVPYFLKIKQEVDLKMHARSGMLEEPYSLIEDQPPKGSSNAGGQRTGEGEDSGLMAQGASKFIQEMFNDKSDNVVKRLNRFLEALNSDEELKVMNEDFAAPRSTYILRYLLETLGLNMDIENYPGISRDDIAKLKTYDGEKLYQLVTKNIKKLQEDVMTEEDVSNILDSINKSVSESSNEPAPF